MRTITTAYDFSIYSPDEYAFIFSPNIMTVTLGASYASNELVTVTGNGVTLSRRAINSVAKFDLMPIFESKFPNTTFNIFNTSAIADPLFASLFSVGVNVASATQVVQFALRWGALQHDDLLLYEDYKFPFWPDMPMVINNPLYHLYWSHNIGAGNVGYSPILLPVSTSAQFVYTIANGASVQNVTYYPADCPSGGRYMRWIDAYGRVVNFMFSAHENEGIPTTTENGTKIKRFPSDYTDSTVGRDISISKPKQRTLSCYATVDTDIFGIVSSVVSSPIVYLYLSGRWIRVNIKPVQITPSKTWLSDIEFVIELPADYIQRL